MQMMGEGTGFLFWGFLIVYGVIMFVISPKAVTLGGFFKGTDKKGKAASSLMITASVFIAWIFAKSVYNCANMGYKFGIVGGIGYAVYWLCIPLTGWAIYRLRRRFGAKSMTSFLTSNYGVAAAFCFSAAILVRLFNEIWSNTSVTGGYYGESGSMPFIIAALLFTLITLAYSCWGGLRSSLITDVLQAGLFVVLLVWVIFFILPAHPIGDYLSSGSWTLDAGVDFILGAALQCLSYGFHDAVLTDRGFICEEKKMLKCFTVAGLLGFVAITLFSLIGVDAMLSGLEEVTDAAQVVAQGMGIAAFFLMAIMMTMCGGSTLDSTFSSLAKLTARDLPAILGKNPHEKARWIGIGFMVVFAFVGNLPMIVGTDILSATTISGTMIMGLGPIFLLHGAGPIKPTKIGFHLAFWIGMILGIIDTVDAASLAFMNIGGGSYANFLGVNFWGAILCWLGYIIPGVIANAMDKTEGRPAWKGRTDEEIAALDAEHAKPEWEDIDPEGIEIDKKDKENREKKEAAA